MFIVDREHFIAWTEGILMINNNGNVFAVDELKCKEAEERLYKGEEVGFTVNDNLVSKIFKNSDGEFIEELIQ